MGKQTQPVRAWAVIFWLLVWQLASMALRAAYPGANIVAVDYDPGASEVNQLNRIKLMLTAAQRALHTQQPSAPKGSPQQPSSPSISLPHPKVAML